MAETKTLRKNGENGKIRKHQKMKQKYFFYLLLLCCSMLACEQSTPPPTKPSKISEAEKQIAKELIQGAFDHLWGGVDSTKILDYHTADFIILEQGEIWDNDRIKAFMRDQLAKPKRPKRINKMDYISIDKYGESMQIAYHNFADFVEADSIVFKAQWLESALAVETDKGWRLKMMHSTWVPQKKEE